jgi:F0F1-type ATP synthase membrane subunit b/b'
MVYIFVSKIVAPGLEKTLENRAAYISDLVKRANKLMVEADKVEKKSIVALENAELESSAAEIKLMSDFREKSIRTKKSLYTFFSERSKKEAEILSQSADEVFSDISRNIDDILEVAMNRVSVSAGKK